MIIPVYLAEISPKRIRGSMVTFNIICVCLGYSLIRNLKKKIKANICLSVLYGCHATLEAYVWVWRSTSYLPASSNVVYK